MNAYGFLGGRKITQLAPMPRPHELNIRYQAQSLETRNGVVAPLRSFEEAQRILARANKPRVRIPVTVPQPK